MYICSGGYDTSSGQQGKSSYYISFSIEKGVLPRAIRRGYVLQPSSPNNELLMKVMLINTPVLDLLPSVTPSDCMTAELVNEGEILISFKTQT